MEIIEIELPICHVREGCELKSEVSEVQRIGENQYRLLYSPGVVEGVARGDVIEICHDDPKGFRVIHRSRFLCVWFYFQDAGSNRGAEGDQVRRAVERAGGVCDGGGNTHLIFSIPVSKGFPAVEALFDGLASQYAGSSWCYGNVYDPWNHFEPLGWWDETE